MGRTITLPCEVGDTLYVVTPRSGVRKEKVWAFWIGEDGKLMILTEHEYISADRFGISVFLTRDEAELKNACLKSACTFEADERGDE